VGIEASDPSGWERFATEVLGMESAEATEDGGRFFRMDDRHHRLAVHAGSSDDLRYAAWEVDDASALEAVAERLEAMGHAITWGTSPEAKARWVERFFRVTDPSGLTNEVYCGLARGERPFASPREIGGFVTGALGMGHFVLCVEQAEACLRFYREGLGLELSDTIAVDMGPAGTKDVAFLHAGPRHHALAIVPLAAPKRLHHIMLQVADMNDVGRTYDRCLDEAVPIASTLGCHTNDRMVSFYMQSPSGFQVECGHGGVEIDDDWEVAHYDAPSIWGHRPPAE
jgi:biphenyl-2,3-diol 1,2-dioxygenase